MNKKSLLLLPLIALSACRYRSGGSRGTHGQQYVVKKEDKGSQITRDEALALLEDIDKNWCDGFDNYQKVSMYARNEESYFTSNIEIGFDLKEDDQYGYRTYVQSFDYNKQKCKKKKQTSALFLKRETSIQSIMKNHHTIKTKMNTLKGTKLKRIITY